MTKKEEIIIKINLIFDKKFKEWYTLKFDQTFRYCVNSDYDDWEDIFDELPIECRFGVYVDFFYENNILITPPHLRNGSWYYEVKRADEHTFSLGEYLVRKESLMECLSNAKFDLFCIERGRCNKLNPDRYHSGVDPISKEGKGNEEVGIKIRDLSIEMAEYLSAHIIREHHEDFSNYNIYLKLAERKSALQWVLDPQGRVEVSSEGLYPSGHRFESIPRY